MEIFQCRLCDGKLRTVLDLGDLYVSGFIEDEDSFGQKEPLTLAVCKNCGLAQLKHIVDPDRMYRQYWYKSSLNPTMLEALRDVVVSSIGRWIGSKSNPVAVDIGANDGSMLAMYPDHFTTIGFDPALNLREEAESNCDYFINDYFSWDAIQDKWPTGIGRADIVTAIAMFYDLNTPREFLENVKAAMCEDGIFVIQMTDMTSMLKVNAFDNLCHEHASYYTLIQAIKLLNDHGFIVFDVEYNMVNGGSVRIYAAKRNSQYSISPTVLAEIGREAQYLQQYDDPFLAFSIRVMNIALAVNKYMLCVRGEGWPIYALGASTKGNTLLQYFGLDRRTIIAIGEVNEDKFGKRTVGTNIPIVPESNILEAETGTIVILPWHFRDFFIKKLWNHMEEGFMELLFPLPEPEIVYVKNGELCIEPLLDKEIIVPWAK